MYLNTYNNINRNIRRSIVDKLFILMVVLTCKMEAIANLIDEQIGF